jgi:DNA (cytosine-5)-methyltransferase 1
MVRSCASLFSGCGGSDTGMRMAGFTPVFGVEFDPEIAKLFALNHAADLQVTDILEVRSIPSVDLLWVSPPCPSFSLANQNRGETAQDIKLAQHLGFLICESKPENVAIENVPAYSKSQSFAILVDALLRGGYQVHAAIYNSADFGVPQQRKRLIIRASRHCLSQVGQSHSRSPEQLDLFGEKRRWVGWSEVIDFNHLQEQPLTQNQLAALGANPPTLTLIERTGYRGGVPCYWSEKHPAPTIRSHPHHDRKGTYRVAYNVAYGKESFAADNLCLAAWQSFPADYRWGESRAVAAKAIGNAVPPLMAAAISRSFSCNP